VKKWNSWALAAADNQLAFCWEEKYDNDWFGVDFFGTTDGLEKKGATCGSFLSYRCVVGFHVYCRFWRGSLVMSVSQRVIFV